MKCKDCRFWDGREANYGFCRRYPPKVIVSGCGAGEFPEYSNDWPSTHKDDWCGEFKPKKERA